MPLPKSHLNDLPISDPLVGKFFHTYKADVMEHQGEILCRVAEGLYLVQTFEWLMGSEYEQHLETLANMTAWKFYDCHEDMQLAYDRYRAQLPEKAV